MDPTTPPQSRWMPDRRGWTGPSISTSNHPYQAAPLGPPSTGHSPVDDHWPQSSAQRLVGGYVRAPQLNLDPSAQFWDTSEDPWSPQRLSFSSTLSNDSPLYGPALHESPVEVPYRVHPVSDHGSEVSGHPNGDSGYGTRPSSITTGGTDPNLQAVITQDQPSGTSERSGRQARGKGGSTSSRIERPSICKYCLKQVRLPSEMKKHLLRHEKPFVCDEPDCDRGMGFTTVNDLDRHKKSIHKIMPPGSKMYRCASEHCTEKNKQWPRLDNFRQHCERMHRGENIEELVERSQMDTSGERHGAPRTPSEMPASGLGLETSAPSLRSRRSSHGLSTSGKKVRNRRGPARQRARSQSIVSSSRDDRVEPSVETFEARTWSSARDQPPAQNPRENLLGGVGYVSSTLVSNSPANMLPALCGSGLVGWPSSVVSSQPEMQHPFGGNMTHQLGDGVATRAGFRENEGFYFPSALPAYSNGMQLVGSAPTARPQYGHLSGPESWPQAYPRGSSQRRHTSETGGYAQRGYQHRY